MITATELYAPNLVERGDHFCFFCGASCTDKFAAKKFVKPTFTELDLVARPGSECVCGPCIHAMSGHAETVDLDGEVRTGRAGAPRMYSWLLQGTKPPVAFNKRHMGFVRKLVLAPPAPPFALVLSDSGQKQLMYRAPVNTRKGPYRVLLENEIITVDTGQLQAAMEAALFASAAIGKKALADPDTAVCYMACVDFFGDETVLEDWLRHYQTPQGRLAAWIAKGKEDARIDDCVQRRIQTAPRRLAPRGAATGSERSNERVGDQLGLDFA